jgi:zinc protease
MRKLISLLISLTILTIAAGCATTGKKIGRAASPGLNRKEVTAFQLPNGINLVVKETDKSAPTSIQVWVTGGSSFDPKDRQGMAHFVERMLLAGSLHYTEGKAEQYLESIGGRLSSHTSRDFSYFAATIPGQESSKGGWKKAEEILFDMVANPSFNEAQMEEQRRTILLEAAQRSRAPETKLTENLFAAAYKVNPYKNPVTGLTDNVNSFTRKDVADFYQSTYIPSNITVVVAGGVDARQVKANIESTFGAMKPSGISIPAAPCQENCQADTRRCELKMPVKLAYAELGWHICSANSPDIYALEVLSTILGRGRGSRLYMELRERQGIAYGIKAEMFPLREPGLLAVQARMDPDNVEQFQDEVLRQVNRLKDEYVPEEELDRAKNMIAAAHLINGETSEGQAYALGYWAAVYRGADPEQYMQGINNVTAEGVRRAALKYLGEGNYTLSVIVPENK